MPLSDKATAATTLLASQLTRLENAERIFAADRLERGNLATTRKLLRKVRGGIYRMQRDPEFHASLGLGFQGPNGWGPLVDRTCDYAEQLAGEQWAAA